MAVIYRGITIGTFGLDNAGKTTVLKVLKEGKSPSPMTDYRSLVGVSDSLDGIAPTVGFATVSFQSRRFNITLFDLGGGSRIRDIWKNYFAEVMLKHTQAQRLSVWKFSCYGQEKSKNQYRRIW